MLLFSFRINAIEHERRELIDELPNVPSDVSEIDTTELYKKVCPKHPLDDLHSIALIRLKTTMEPTWKDMVNYDAVLVKVFNAKAYRKQADFKASVISRVLLPCNQLNCNCY